jgi:glucose/arabinose dehydrogenase
MSGQRLVRLRINGEKVVEDETLIRGIGRIRDVQQGRDGLIYLAIDANVRGADGAPTAILRMVPVPRAE